MHEYKDGAKVYFPKTWDGQKLTFRGEGFKTLDGKGSVIAVKLNKGAISAKVEPKLAGVEGNSAGIWAYIKADENGNFTATIDRPTVANSNLTEELKTGDSVAIYLLSGSLTENDNVRGGVAAEYTFSVDNQAPAPKASESANAPVTNPSEAPSAPADSKEQVKENAKDQSKAPADSLKSDAQKKDSTAPKTSGSSSQNVTSSNNGSTASSSSKSSLANTGASGIVVAAGIGVLALVVGATVLVARRRKA